MALPQRKPEEAPQLERLSNAELLDRACCGDKRAADILRSRMAVNEFQDEMVRAKFDSVRRLGLEAIIREAKAMRADWKAHLVNHVRHERSRHLPRAELIREIRGFCLQRRYEGKNGEAVKESTIRRWLTRELEQEIRDLALQTSR